jgi:hypothetical protein
MVRDDLHRISTRIAVAWAAIASCLFAPGGIAVAQEFHGPFAAAVEGLLPGEAGGEDEEDEHIETDRDSFTPATTLVGRGRVMIEGSYSFIDNRSGPDSNSYPELLTRVGLSDWFELRLGWNYEAGGGGAVSGTEVGGDEDSAAFETESKILYGFKVAVSDQDVWLPRSALIAHATTPTSGENTATQFVLGYVAGWTLPNKWDLDSSVRYIAANEEGDHFNQWAPSIVLKVPFGENWNAHAEYFGIFSDGQAKNVNPQYFSPGIHYLITPDCEVGTRVGWGLNDDAADFFANVGMGVRF